MAAGQGRFLGQDGGQFGFLNLENPIAACPGQQRRLDRRRYGFRGPELGPGG